MALSPGIANGGKDLMCDGFLGGGNFLTLLDSSGAEIPGITRVALSGVLVRSSNKLINSSAVAVATTSVAAGTAVAWAIYSLATGGTLLASGLLRGARCFFAGHGDDDKIHEAGNSFVANTPVLVETVTGLSNASLALPTGLTARSRYFVRDEDNPGGTRKLALTAGGAAIDLTADGVGWIAQDFRTDLVNSGDSVNFAIGTLQIDLTY